MARMLNHILPLFVSMHNVTICLEKILAKAQFDSLALIHLNKTVDFADNIYAQLAIDTNYAWMRFDMDNKATLENHLMENKFLSEIFFVYVLDNFLDWQYVYEFIVSTKLDNRNNQIYIVNQYPTLQDLKRLGIVTFNNQFYNFGALFWNSSGRGIEAYTFNGFRKDFVIQLPVVDDQCSDNVYNQIFFDKTLNFYGSNLTIYGQTEPPRIVRTVTWVNEQYEHSIGGHDVLIMDAISKYLNVSAKFKLMLESIYMINATFYESSEKPENNIEEKIFNVSRIVPFDWEVPGGRKAYILIYANPAIDMNSKRMNYELYLETRRTKDYTFLYPHDRDHSIIVVPKKLKSKTDYIQLLKSALVLVWAPVTIAATIVRFVFNKVMKTEKKFIDLYLEIFGLSLGMSFNAAAIKSAAENFFLWWFCLGTMLSGMLLSSSMFQGFALQTDIPTINNLKDLERSGLEIQLPLYSESVKSFFETTPFTLKLNQTLEHSISEMISNGNTSYAYVIREAKFNILFKDNEIWHVVERFGFEYLSFRLHFYIGIEERINNLIQRCVDHGIVSYLVAKNKRLLSGTRCTDQKFNSLIVNSVSVSEMQDAFLLYALGILLSLITFTVEAIYFWKSRNT